MRSEIADRVERAIREKVFPGCVLGTVRRSGEREVFPFGYLTYENGPQNVERDTVYDLASVTKSIPTASLALMFAAEGKLEHSDPVKKFIPELQNDHDATVEHLLTYAVHGVQMSTLTDKTPEEMEEYIFAHGFDGPPEESKYTNLPAFLLGIVLERVAGDTLDHLSQKYFFDPLEMSQTAFFPNIGVYETTNIAPSEIDEGGKEIRGIVHDESARVFARAGRAVGHAGLFSTAPDVLNFLEALLQGKYPHIVEGAQNGLGWQIDGPLFGNPRGDASGFGKTGFTGTSVVCDLERGIAFVILSNRTYPKRPRDATSPHSAINLFRADIADILLGKS